MEGRPRLSSTRYSTPPRWLNELPLPAYFEANGITTDFANELLDARIGVVRGRYDYLLPFLIPRMLREDDRLTKAAIAMVVGACATRPYWSVLKEEFEKAAAHDDLYSDVLANIFLSATRNDVEYIADLIEHSMNPSRIILLRVLRKFRNKSAVAAAALARFALDPGLTIEISSWPKRRPVA